MNTSNTHYRLDFILTRVHNDDGTYRDLPIEKFLAFPGGVVYNTREEAECARVDLSRTANNGYYRVVEF